MSHLPTPLRVSLGVGTALAGIAMLVLPGPGLLTIAAAVHILAHDLPALRPLSERVRAWVARLAPLSDAPAV